MTQLSAVVYEQVQTDQPDVYRFNMRSISFNHSFLPEGARKPIPSYAAIVCQIAVITRNNTVVEYLYRDKTRACTLESLSSEHTLFMLKCSE